MADVPLNSLVGGGSNYVQLTTNQGLTASSTSAIYTQNLLVTGVNIASALTQMCSVDAPVGSKLILLSVLIGNINGTSNALTLELEIDGATRLNQTAAISTDSSVYLVGHGVIPNNDPRYVKELEVLSNFKVRAQKLLSTSANISVNYILVRP